MRLVEAERIDAEDRQEIDPQFAEGAQKEAEKKKLFEGFTFFVSREIQKELFEFCIKAFGGRVVYHIDNYKSEVYRSPEITHVLVDKPLDFVDKVVNREYVQPQWVCDSINFNVLLPVSEYVPGKHLPPHLSPFVDDAAAGFVPERKKEILKYQGEYVEESVADEEEEALEEEEIPAPKKKQASAVPTKRAKGKYKVEEETFDVEKRQKKEAIDSKRQQKEEDKLREMMLTKKRQRLLGKIEKSDDKTKQRIQEIKSRKVEIKKGNKK
jgi:pescadillo protein